LKKQSQALKLIPNDVTGRYSAPAQHGGHEGEAVLDRDEAGLVWRWLMSAESENQIFDIEENARCFLR
jgi:hypothetical protein